MNKRPIKADQKIDKKLNKLKNLDRESSDDEENQIVCTTSKSEKRKKRQASKLESSNEQNIQAKEVIKGLDAVKRRKTDGQKDEEDNSREKEKGSEDG